MHFFKENLEIIISKKNEGVNVGSKLDYVRLCKINGVFLYVKVQLLFMYKK